MQSRVRGRNRRRIRGSAGPGSGGTAEVFAEEETDPVVEEEEISRLGRTPIADEIDETVIAPRVGE